MFIRLIFASCVVVCSLASIVSRAAEPVVLQTGPAFRKELDGITDIKWGDKRTLRDALVQLSDAKRIAIILDRRVDPDQQVEFSLSDVPLEQALRQLATRLKLGVSFFDSTVYLGPESVTHRMATIAAVQHDRVSQSSTEQRTKLRSVAPVSTPLLGSPRELLQAWADGCGITLQNADAVPHDLWPALNFPQQTAATRATLLLAGFDLAIEFSADGTAARVIPMPEKVTLTRQYAGGGNPKNRGAQIAGKFPRVDVKTEANQLLVTGSFEDHDLIARLLRGETIRRVEVGPGEKRYTLNVENQPLAAVARALAKELKMEVEFDPSIVDTLPQRISFKVKDVSLEELFKTMLEPTQLDFLFMENKIQIVPKK